MKSLACVEISGFLGAVNVMVGIYLLKSPVCLGLFAMLTCCGDLSLLHAMVGGFSCGSLWVFLWIFGFLQFARLCVDLVNLVFGLLQEKKRLIFQDRSPHYMRIPYSNQHILFPNEFAKG